MTITIRVSNVQWPNVGKKTGIVTDVTGKQWGCWPEMLNTLQVGGTYAVEYSTRQWNNKNYFTISKATPVTPQMTAPNQIPNGQAPSPSRLPYGGVSDDERRMDIFICGAVNNYLSNPSINPADMSMMDMMDLMHKFKGAWLGVFGPSPVPRPAPQQQRSAPMEQSIPQDGPEDDMDDSIPF